MERTSVTRPRHQTTSPDQEESCPPAQPTSTASGATATRSTQHPAASDRRRTPPHAPLLLPPPQLLAQLLMLMLLATVPSQCAAAAGPALEWQRPATAPGVYLPQQFGVQRLSLSGPLLLANGSTVYPQATVYVKAIPQQQSAGAGSPGDGAAAAGGQGDAAAGAEAAAGSGGGGPPGGLAVRAVAFFYDTVQQTPVMAWGAFPMHLLAVADYMTRVEAAPSFYLRPVRFRGGPGNSGDPSGQLQLIRQKPTIVSKQHLGVNSSEHADQVLFQRGGDEYVSVLPYVLGIHLPESDLAEVEGYTFCIDEWYQCALLPLPVLRGEVLNQAGGTTGAAPSDPQLQDVGEGSGPQKEVKNEGEGSGADQPVFFAFTKPVFGVSPALAAALLYHRTTFYVQLGFAGTLLYERGGYLQQFLESPKLRGLLEDGQLSIMLWTHDQSGVPMIPIEQSFWGNYDQWMLHTHAALALWGRNAYLLIADWDEYIKLPEGVRIQHLFAPGGCLAGVPYASLSRFNYHCEDGAAPEDGGGDKGLLPYLYKCTGREPEYKEWPKVLVLADATAYLQVHDGFLYPQYAAAARDDVDESCASLVHLHTLVKNRVHDTPREHDDTWLHPFRHTERQQQPGEAASGQQQGAAAGEQQHKGAAGQGAHAAASVSASAHHRQRKLRL